MEVQDTDIATMVFAGGLSAAVVFFIFYKTRDADGYYASVARWLSPLIGLAIYGGISLCSDVLGLLGSGASAVAATMHGGPR